jgi:hypothetical protein
LFDYRTVLARDVGVVATAIVGADRGTALTQSMREKIAQVIVRRRTPRRM